MAVTMTEITGEVYLPDGVPPEFGSLEFRLSGVALDTPHMFAPDPVSVETEPDGTFQVHLQSTTGKCVHYDVALRYRRAGEQEQVLDLGTIEVSAVSPQVLADLLPDPCARDGSAVVVGAGQAGSAARRASSPEVVAFKRGDTITIGALIVTRYGQVQDLTGAVLAASMRGPDKATRGLTVTVDANPATGRVVLSMDPALTADLPIGTHVVDIKRTNSDGTVRRTPTLEINILDEVTP